MYKIFITLVALSSTLLCTEKPKLTDYKKSIYSQWGEDGIIEKIFEIMGTTSKVAVEFGAHDGFSCSNTAHLWSNDPGWQGILIEADQDLYQKMAQNVARYNCIPLHCKVGISATDSLETILEQTHITQPIDLLSIDIDGDDYHIFKSLNSLRPRLIICEYNPSIPAHFDIYADYPNNVGCSVAALQRIATEKGYSLIAITDTNCFFVRNEDFPRFAAFDTDREHLRVDRYIAYIINDFKSCYKVIGTPDYRDAWGWAGKPSQEIFRGNNFIVINEQIQR